MVLTAYLHGKMRLGPWQPQLQWTQHRGHQTVLIQQRILELSWLMPEQCTQQDHLQHDSIIDHFLKAWFVMYGMLGYADYPKISFSKLRRLWHRKAVQNLALRPQKSTARVTAAVLSIQRSHKRQSYQSKGLTRGKPYNFFPGNDVLWRRWQDHF